MPTDTPSPLVAAAEAPTHRHRKGGLYRLLGVAQHTETGEVLAVYRGQDGRLWARPKAMFEDGRFTPLEPAEAVGADAAWRARAEAAVALAEAYARYGEYAHYEPDDDEYPMHIEELYRREDALVAARRRYEETCRAG